ncbi:MAG: ion channel [Actinomycetota bacterium]
MRVGGVLAGAVLVIIVLWESFETLVLPRRVTRRLRITRVYYRGLWGCWSAIGRRHPGTRRENYLSVFAPLSLLLLLAVWVGGVIVGFALIQWGLDTPLRPGGDAAFATHLYLSATTFVTLGLGDVTSASSAGRSITAIEAAAGFAFLALTISYLPVLYQAFSRREVQISMLDQWAGSPPSAVELLRRAAAHGEIGSVDGLLADWEHWSAELLESHLTYPVLAYFRSQHEHQSWLAALTTILDVSALVLAGVEGVSAWQAQRTFAISRHAVVDIAQIFQTPPESLPGDRLVPEDARTMCQMLQGAAVRLDPGTAERLAPLRDMYEPYVQVLSRRLEMALPTLLPAGPTQDDWQRSPWDEPTRKSS